MVLHKQTYELLLQTNKRVQHLNQESCQLSQTVLQAMTHGEIRAGPKVGLLDEAERTNVL